MLPNHQNQTKTIKKGRFMAFPKQKHVDRGALPLTSQTDSGAMPERWEKKQPEEIKNDFVSLTANKR